MRTGNGTSMKYLLDTNTVSEFTKIRRNPQVVAWFSATPIEALFLSTLTIGELRRGVAVLAQKDAARAAKLSEWVSSIVQTYQNRILPVTLEISNRWGLLSAERSRSVVDTILAATAIEHELILVTRNIKDIQDTGAIFFNPFDYSL